MWLWDSFTSNYFRWKNNKLTVKRHKIFWSFAKLYHSTWGSDSVLLGVLAWCEGKSLQAGLLLPMSAECCVCCMHIHTHTHTLQVLVQRWNISLPCLSKQYSLKQSFRSNKKTICIPFSTGFGLILFGMPKIKFSVNVSIFKLLFHPSRRQVGSFQILNKYQSVRCPNYKLEVLTSTRAWAFNTVLVCLYPRLANR